MKNKIFFFALWLSFLFLLPFTMNAQKRIEGGPRGELLKTSETFKNLIGVYTAKGSSCTITSSATMTEEDLEFTVYTQAKGSKIWVMAQKGTIQSTPSYSADFCFAGAKSIMVILACPQKDAGMVTFSKKCKTKM